MAWWIYKCRVPPRAEQHAYGDWNDYFRDPTDHWGNVEWTSDLLQLSDGDMVIAYQTNRNELVGVVKVTQARDQRGFVYFSPVERIGAKVRPLKEKDPNIAAIGALQPGWIATLYPISPGDADVLLKAARATKRAPRRPSRR
ncbi:MAG: hypothetical protein R6U98_29350 [Pirellulaceae bacterium]